MYPASGGSVVPGSGRTAKRRVGIRGILGTVSDYVPYGIGSRLLAGVWRVRYVRNWLYGTNLASLRAVLPLVAPEADPIEAERTYLRCNRTRHWRLRVLSRCSDAEFRNWVVFEGEDILQRAMAKGNGVIVANSHFGAVRCIPLSLVRMGYELHSLETADVLKKVGSKYADKLKVIILGVNQKFLLRQTYMARQVLLNGGLLHSVVDGFQGGSGVDVDFCGRRRGFPASFAQLAVTTGASVVPVIAFLAEDGKITIRFYAPLDPGNADAPSAQRVESMISQYAGLLQTLWREDPGAIRGMFLDRFLDLTPAIAAVKPEDIPETVQFLGSQHAAQSG